MCGHVGIAGSITSGMADIFKELLYIDGLRGQDGTGVCLYNSKRNNTLILKAPTDASTFINSTQSTPLDNLQNWDVVIGHNRAATRGTPAKENTHPFESGHIILAHNGTLYSQGGLKIWKHEVDSASIAHNMSESGEKETLENLYGPFALVWLNTQNKTLNVARNEHRPLCCAFTTDNSTFFWASEKRFLRFVEKGTISFKTFWQPKPLVWFRLDLEAFKLSIQNIKAYVPTYSYERYRGYSHGKEYQTYKDAYFDKYYEDSDNDYALPGFEGYKSPASSPEMEPHTKSLYEKIVQYVKDKPLFYMMPQSFTPLKANEKRGTLAGWATVTDLGGRVGARVFGAPAEAFKDKWVPIRGVGAMYVGTQAAIVAELAPPSESKGDLRGFCNVTLSPSQFLNATQEGCQACEFKPSFDDAPYLRWFSPTTFYCKTCSRKPIKEVLRLVRDKKTVSVEEEAARFIDTYIVRNKYALYKAL